MENKILDTYLSAKKSLVRANNKMDSAGSVLKEKLRLISQIYCFEKGKRSVNRNFKAPWQMLEIRQYKVSKQFIHVTYTHPQADWHNDPYKTYRKFPCRWLAIDDVDELRNAILWELHCEGEEYRKKAEYERQCKAEEKAEKLALKKDAQDREKKAISDIIAKHYGDEEAITEAILEWSKNGR